MMKKLMICMTVLLTGCTTSVDLEQQVDELYAKMSQEERIALLRSMYMDELFDEQGKLDTAKCKQLIPYGIGHFSQFCMQQPREPQVLRDRAIAIQDWLMNNTPNGIPALLHEEVLSGVNTLGSTIYPQQIGQAGSFNPELAKLKTLQTGTVLRKMGGIFALSPMVDVCRTPSFNRLEESYGEDGYLSAVMGTAFVDGLQQGDLKKGVGACSKHYLGYGGGGDADEKEMMEEILLPHEAMIRLTGSVAVMPGYHDVHGIRCVANSEILQDILRDYVGFDGMVVSDYTAIDQIPNIDSVVEKAAAAINAGNDVDFPHGANYQYLQEAIDKGLVKPEVLERAVKNVLRIKFRMGLFDKDAYLYSKEEIKLDSPEERQTAYDIASQSVVLLENNGVRCDWTEDIETKYGETGDARAWEYNLLHRKVDSGEKADKQEALKMAKEADVIVAAMGENVMLCGENRDRQGLRLPGKQEQFVEELIKTGKPVVLVMFGGRAQVIAGLAEKCAAIIQAWYPGEEGGNAVADILYGKVSPSAKLSVSYPNVEIDKPICYNYTAEKDPRIAWPFGYGLSYTTFDYQNLKADAEVATSAECVNVAFEVKNTGKMAADEVVQIYLSPTNEQQQIRPKQLQGFARVKLEPGETKTVKVKLYTDQFGYYSHQDKRQWNVAPGQYEVKVGASSEDIRLQQAITLKGDAITKPLRNHYFSEGADGFEPPTLCL